MGERMEGEGRERKVQGGGCCGLCTPTAHRNFLGDRCGSDYTDSVPRRHRWLRVAFRRRHKLHSCDLDVTEYPRSNLRLARNARATSQILYIDNTIQRKHWYLQTDH